MYLEGCFALFFLLIVLALVAFPVVVFRRIALVNRRVDRLEDEVVRLRRQLRDTLADSPLAIPEVVAVPETDPATPEPQARTAIVAPPPTPARPPRVTAPTDAAGLETFLGQRAMGWIAVVLLLFAVAFFLKYAIDNAWIGELGRVCLGVVGGVALCIGGAISYTRKRPLTCQMLTAAGVVLLYLTTFAAFGFYHLLPTSRGGIYLVLLVIETAALAVIYRAPAIAVMAIVGGLLSPVLLHSDRDQYVNLFLYLGILNSGVVALSLLRGWLWLGPIAFVGTQALYWGWYGERYHPEKMSAAFLFQSALFALYLAHDLVVPALKRIRAHWVQLGHIPIVAGFYAFAGYVLLDWDYNVWMAVAAIGLATVYTLLAGLALVRSPADTLLQLITVSVGLGLVAVAIALRGVAGWISLGWAIEGLALGWFGLRARALPMRIYGGVLLSMAVIRVLTVDLPHSEPHLSTPFFNSYTLPGVIVSICVLLSAWLTRRLRPMPREFDLIARWIGGIGGVLLLWIVLSCEVWWITSERLFVALEGTRDQRLFTQLCLSIFWGVYAGAVLAMGFWQKSAPVRFTALGLFALTLAKGILFDLAGLPGIYRVVAFFVLAVIMGLGAYAYQRRMPTVHPNEEVLREQV